MDAIEVLNTIRDNASQQYQDRVPEATRSNGPCRCTRHERWRGDC